jgi:dTDP-4-dehydrorhamnose reductase
MTRWLVTGARGMLGRDLVIALERRGESVTGLSHSDLDVTDSAAVGSAVGRNQPDVIVNCAAWTAVDDAELREDQAFLINGTGVANLAAACGPGIRMVHISTDYVFDGRARDPYSEADPPAPRSAYGRTKLAGERAVLDLLPGRGYVARTAWLYGAHGSNFVRTMIRLERQRPHVDVVDDQYGQPTWAGDVANQIIALIQVDAPPGVYHATSSGETTWYAFAREIFGLLGADPARVRPTTTGTLARPAPRPGYSVLGHDRCAAVGLPPIDHWQTCLRRAFPALTAADRASGANAHLRRQ